jgi:hypothetical protein
VRQLKDDGADFIKVYFATVPVDVLGAVTEEAHKHGLKVIGHLPTNLSLDEVVQGGLRNRSIRRGKDAMFGYVEALIRF